MAVDDVFLWSFLSDSKADQEWRVVLAYLALEDEAVADDLERARCAEKNRAVASMLRPLEFRFVPPGGSVPCDGVESRCPLLSTYLVRVLSGRVGAVC